MVRVCKKVVHQSKVYYQVLSEMIYDIWLRFKVSFQGVRPSIEQVKNSIIFRVALRCNEFMMFYLVK